MWYVCKDTNGTRMAINTDRILKMEVINQSCRIWFGNGEYLFLKESGFDDIVKYSGKDVYRDYK